jgi:hypothetical protein
MVSILRAFQYIDYYVFVMPGDEGYVAHFKSLCWTFGAISHERLKGLYSDTLTSYFKSQRRLAVPYLLATDNILKHVSSSVWIWSAFCNEWAHTTAITAV